MADTSASADESPSASISPDSAALEPSQPVQQVPETQTQTDEQKSDLGGRSSSSEKSEEDEDDGWMVTPLSLPAGRRYERVSSEDLTEEDEADVEASVREALRLLEDSDEVVDDGGQEQESWGQASRDGGYVDFVHEVMEDRWTLEDSESRQSGHWRTPEGRADSEEEEMEDEQADRDEQPDEQEDGAEKQEDVEEKQEKEHVVEDEWQEAYTAKGRVYYYNRRTRESSWKKPNHYNSSSDEPQPAAAATEEESELHRSVEKQSLGYHPSASASALPAMERQTTLFCSFCGEQQLAEQLAAHFQECATAKFHKRRMSPLYSSFERALGLMSEDATLRSLHYASSLPDPTPHGRPGATSMQDSLLLLRPRRRHGNAKMPNSAESTPQKQRTHRNRISDTPTKESPERRTRQDADRSPARQATDAGTPRRKLKSIKRKGSQATASAFAGGPAVQHMETCRYCKRSFAEGRLAKHEAVCPRVFGNEGSWGRGTPSNQVSPPNSRYARVGTPPSSAGSTTSKLQKLKDHTLQQSYKEHQATLVLCPCCRRKFAPSGAQQHIAICKGVQNRPKNPIPLLRDYAIAS